MMKIANIVRRGSLAALTGLFLLVGGCGDLFDIENPGQILDTDLDDVNLIDVLIVGLSSDVSDFMDNVGPTP